MPHGGPRSPSQSSRTCGRQPVGGGTRSPCRCSAVSVAGASGRARRPPSGAVVLQPSRRRRAVERWLGFSIRPIHGSHQRSRCTRRDYVDAVEAATRAAERCWAHDPATGADRRPGVGLRAAVASAYQGCTCSSTTAVEGLVPTRVDEVDTVVYDGPVYDLEVDGTHNFVAEHICVRNSIYKFRGADMRNILEFENAFPDVTIVVLEQNYRSTQTILDAANAVIGNNLEPQAQGAVDRSGRRQPDRAVPRRRRGGRSPVGHPRDRQAARRRRPALGRRRRLLPHQRPEPGGGGEPHPHGRAVQGDRRHPLLRPA